MLKIGLFVIMISSGVLSALFLHLISMPLSNNTLIHCLVLGFGFGMVNYLLANWYISRNAQIKRDYEMLKLKVYVDDLTGLLNRKALDLDSSELSDENFSILFIDVDNFRAFNNQYGHKFGDNVLHEVCNVVRYTIRCGDKAYRYGGEEIVVLLKDCEKKNALQIAEKIRCQVNNLDNDPYPPITVSLGVASCPEDGGTIQEVLEKSDHALLLAKNLGKNRTLGYDSLTIEEIHEHLSKYDSCF
ncbi:GGDEF domain-containing protein [Desulfitobacterium sp. THU1]|uniref:GGDEF domain-containing protein n=1 Tax=Desulfitobacterium sp. THU1 TaxID=3138072 RepID=UPI003120462A